MPLRKAPKPTRRAGLLNCSACCKQFSVTIGTVFEDSHIPLNKWLLAFHLLCASKKGMSAHQLHRMLGITYKNAWFMAHRIRYAMTQEPLSSKLTGRVEIDEVYIGGKMRTGTARGKAGRASRRIALSATDNKASVVSVLQRGGRVQSVHMPRVTGEKSQDGHRSDGGRIRACHDGYCQRLALRGEEPEAQQGEPQGERVRPQRERRERSRPMASKGTSPIFAGESMASITTLASTTCIVTSASSIFGTILVTLRMWNALSWP